MSKGQIIMMAGWRGLTFTQNDVEYRLCNGQTLSRASYPALDPLWPEGVYGSTASLIVLPDLLNRHLRCLDMGRGVDLGASSRTAPSGTLPVGDSIGSFQGGNMTSHTHPLGTRTLYQRGGDGGASPGLTRNPQNGAGASDIESIGGQAYTRHSTVFSGTTNDDFDVPSTYYYPYMQMT